MTEGRISRTVGIAMALVTAALLAGCGGDDLVIGVTPTPTATRTATTVQSRTATPLPTNTPRVSAQVAGVIVVNDDVGSGPSDGLTPLPPESLPPVGTGFDRGLGNADWRVDDGGVRGTTTGEGRFSIAGLTQGRHLLRVSRTIDGNLLEFVVPIVVGGDGAAEVVAEVSWGMVRATSLYTQDGASMRAIFAPNATSLITRDGRVVELGDGVRTLVDADGDGHFDPRSGACDELSACGADGGCGSPERICVCIPSCPDCEDCPAQACVPRGYFMQPECGPDGLCKALPYQCTDNGECAKPDDHCSCVSACLGCDQCVGTACVAPCDSGRATDIVRIDINGPSRLVIGQDGSAGAVATLSDGTAIDVTWLATWASSAPEVATVDAWGRITAVAAGATDLTAALGEVASAPLHLDVVERPTLRRIYLQNVGCTYPVDVRGGPVAGPPPQTPDANGVFQPPSCQQVLRIGGTIQFSAIGEFDTGYYQDITKEVEWRLNPSGVGGVVDGLFTAEQAGAVTISAALAGVESDLLTVTVVTESSVVALSIYPSDYRYQYLDRPPTPSGDVAPPCFDCGFAMTLLRGDKVQFAATAHYDTGEWQDVTARVAWRSSDPTVAAIDAAGLMTAGAAGDASIDASLGDVRSGTVALHIVDQATLVNLSIYVDGQDRVVAKGAQATFHAIGYYDVGFDRAVTAEVTWHSSDESVGGFDSPGTFTGRAAGTVTIWAELAGQQSQPLPFEVFATSELDYCDPANVNRGIWSDDFNRVTLESDCAAYSAPDVVELRFSVTETQRPGGVFDPCLDLYAFHGDTLVRTIRHEGCGDPFLPAGAPDRDDQAPKYQLKAFWDLKDERGESVPPGVYSIRGVFYLYYDPVVSIEVTVSEAPPAS